MSVRTMLSAALLAGAALLAVARAQADTPAPAAVVVAARSGARLAISADARRVDIRSDALQLVGDSRGDKRYYHRGTGGEAVVEVKSGSDGFKLRTPAGKLLWKVKIAADKIKISDNEDNGGAWTIKIGPADRVKVVDPSGNEAGEVKTDGVSGKIRIKDAAAGERYVVEAGGRSAAYGALLIAAVPKEFRSVITAELLARGR